MLQASGAEVIHLGHNRSVDEIVTAALQEDVHGIAVSSYQGGHIEFFKYMIDLLRERGGANIKLFGGGGGVIVPAEIAELHRLRRDAHLLAGGRRAHGPAGHDRRHARDARIRTCARACPHRSTRCMAGDRRDLARVITALEGAALPEVMHKALLAQAEQRTAVPVLGVTGTGGSGKSSLTDELIRRFRLDQADRLKIAVIAVDPSRRKTGGALLGDRIRMNAINGANIYMRSLATRSGGSEIAACLPDVIAACKCAGFDLVIVETSGIGQGDAAIVPLVDCIALRHDSGVRRGQPAREDRHAGLRRLRGDQQVRPPRRGGRAARRLQAVPAQPQGLLDSRRTRCRCSARWPRASTTTASPRCTRPSWPS